MCCNQGLWKNDQLGEALRVGAAGALSGVEGGEEFLCVGDASRPFPTPTIPLLRLGRRCRAASTSALPSRMKAANVHP